MYSMYFKIALAGFSLHLQTRRNQAVNGRKEYFADFMIVLPVFFPAKHKAVGDYKTPSAFPMVQSGSHSVLLT